MTMRKYVETFILFVVGLGPTLIALLLMQQYGAIGVSCAIVLSAVYLLCIIIALCCRICMPPAESDSDEEDPQGDGSDDLPPSYEIVTSKPPPYYVLFASTPPPVGEVTEGGFVSSSAVRRSELSTNCEVPVHSYRTSYRMGGGNTKGIHCYAWLEPCEDKDLPSYEDALILCSLNFNNGNNVVINNTAKDESPSSATSLPIIHPTVPSTDDPNDCSS